VRALYLALIVIVAPLIGEIGVFELFNSQIQIAPSNSAVSYIDCAAYFSWAGDLHRKLVSPSGEMRGFVSDWPVCDAGENDGIQSMEERRITDLDVGDLVLLYGVAWKQWESSSATSASTVADSLQLRYGCISSVKDRDNIEKSIHSYCWRLPCILIMESEFNGRMGWIEYESVGDLYVSESPGTIISRHLVQLSLHNIKLSPKYNGGHDADDYESAGKQADMTRPPRHHPLVDLVLGIAATAAAVLVAFKSAEYADDHGLRFWWLPFLGFLALAFWIAAHAIPIGLPS
jgi:hypothetical protein